MFGSQGHNLKDLILGEDAPPPLEFNKKRSRYVKIVKRDSRSIKTVRLKAFVAPPSSILCFYFITFTYFKIVWNSSCMAHCHEFYGSQRLSVGGTAEKIVSAFDMVLNEHSNEDAEMSKCKSAVHRVRKMEKDVDIACAIGKLSTEQK